MVLCCLGVLYHLEDAFNCLRLLHGLLSDQGTFCTVTQMSAIQRDVPILGFTSDLYQSVSHQDEHTLREVGIRNHGSPRAVFNRLDHEPGAMRRYSKNPPVSPLRKGGKRRESPTYPPLAKGRRGVYAAARARQWKSALMNMRFATWFTLMNLIVHHCAARIIGARRRIRPGVSPGWSTSPHPTSEARRCSGG